jgi:hypothetical protein
MMIIYLSLLVAIVGLLMFGLSTAPNGKMIEIGKIMFWTGLLAFLLTDSGLSVLLNGVHR